MKDIRARRALKSCDFVFFAPSADSSSQHYYSRTETLRLSLLPPLQVPLLSALLVGKGNSEEVWPELMSQQWSHEAVTRKLSALNIIDKTKVCQKFL